MKHKKLGIVITILVIVVIILGIVAICFRTNNTELKSIKSKKELERIYNHEYNSGISILKEIVTMPFSMFYWSSTRIGIMGTIQSTTDSSSVMENAVDSAVSSEAGSTSTSKDYSTTNIQVENVDEADIIKTDGDYIYSISGNNVIITNVIEEQNPKISTKISEAEGIPEDLIIYKGNTLVVILSDVTNIRYNNNTIVNVYDISDKENPRKVKTYKMYEPYYTSRCINNKLYVISSGSLRKDDDDKIITYYEEGKEEKEIGLENIKYLTDINTRNQTLISFVDLDEPEKEVKINSYLIDIQNSYVSEENIYLLNQEYESNDVPPISSLFGLKGAIGPFEWIEENRDYGYYTNIYKFKILDNGEIEYKTKAKIKGKTINQYSLDEYEKNLRIALCDNKKGSRVVVFDENLNEIGTSGYIAKGETMYSSRFTENKVYLVTYQTIDPLFVIDLSNPKKPEVLRRTKNTRI